MELAIYTNNETSDCSENVNIHDWLCKEKKWTSRRVNKFSTSKYTLVEYNQRFRIRIDSII